MLSLAARTTETTIDTVTVADSDQVAVEATPFDPHLIEGLKSDHASLRATLDLLEQYILHHQFAKIPDLLTRFGEALQSHLAEEREHFYGRVAVCVRDDPATSIFVARASARMDGIARQTMIFIKRYIGIGVCRVNKDAFRRDLEVVAALLCERIELEETSLYPLYRPIHRTGHSWIDAPRHEREFATL